MFVQQSYHCKSFLPQNIGAVNYSPVLKESEEGGAFGGRDKIDDVGKSSREVVVN